MTTADDDSRALFLEALATLGRSVRRLEGHRDALRPIMPLDAERLGKLDDPALTRIEAMLKKFDQTVDELRRRAFRGVLILAAEPVEGMSVRQMLERLATLGAIPSARPSSGSSSCATSWPTSTRTSRSCRPAS